MNMHTDIITWATNYLSSKGYILKDSHEILLETPWSRMLRFSTSKGMVYLKQPMPLIAGEARIIQLLSAKFKASVPVVIGSNDELHCFLMEDAGQNLRGFLKLQFNLDILCQSIQQFTKIQRTVENDLEPFLALKIPDRRLNKLHELYELTISETAFLKAEGITDKELQILQDLSPKILAEIQLLSQYQIPETIVQPDFNTNNIVINPETNQLTFIDFGEIALAHPFFSLHNFLHQVILHHEIQEGFPAYLKLRDVGMEIWQEYRSNQQILEGFYLAKKLWPVYSAIVLNHFRHVVDLKELKAWYVHRPNPFAGTFREIITAFGYNRECP